MAVWTPDPTFYHSPRQAMSAPRERLAYVAPALPPPVIRPFGAAPH